MFDINHLLAYGNPSELDSPEAAKHYGTIIENIFSLFSIDVKIINHLYISESLVFEISLASGTRVSNIKKLKADISLQTGCFVTIAGKKSQASTIAIVLRKNPRYVLALKDIMTSSEYVGNTSPLLIAAGRDTIGEPLLIDLTNENMLVFGTTGSGKSVFLDDVILSLVYRCEPEQLKLVLIDVKGVDLAYYNDIPYLHLNDNMKNVAITERQSATKALADVLVEMRQRQTLFEENHIKSFDQYNNLPDVKKLPYIVIVIDEYHELVNFTNIKRTQNGELDISEPVLSPEEIKMIEDDINATKNMVRSIVSDSRRFGISMVIATQMQAAKDIDTGIQNNMHHRVRFSIYNGNSGDDKTKTVHDKKLLGSGDMQYERTGGTNSDMRNIIRGQACYVSGDEVKEIVNEIQSQLPYTI